MTFKQDLNKESEGIYLDWVVEQLWASMANKNEYKYECCDLHLDSQAIYTPWWQEARMYQCSVRAEPMCSHTGFTPVNTPACG